MSDTNQGVDSFNKSLFGKNFAWGVSTASFQTEGSCDADGKGASIWDIFTKRKGKIKDRHNAVIACDFYQRYKTDIDLIKQLNIPNFRFSISWTRILPNGTGEINQLGIDHYNDVINYCIEQGVEPWLTVYHWDLPQVLEDKGGWTNRAIVDWFTQFITICAQSFGDRVKHWMVLNEPAVFVGAGYFFGLHAPGRAGLRNYLPAAHHAVLAMVAGGRVLRRLLPDAEIGTTFSCSHIEPNTTAKRDINAAKRTDVFINRLFIEPILGLGYPVDEIPVLRGIKKFILPGDEENMQFDFDFIGLQNYTREIVKYSFFTPYVNASLVKAADRKVETTEIGWEVYPQAIYHVIKKFAAYPGVKKIVITENGSAFKDEVTNGEVNDPKRTAFLKSNLQQVLRAKQEGCNVCGYFVWTITDNFEWAEGYHPRFGLIYIDFETQQRTVKDSGKWYADFLK